MPEVVSGGEDTSGTRWHGRCSNGGMLDKTTQMPATDELDLQRPSRLESIHAVSFTLGFFMSAAGLFFSIPALAVMGGPCLIASAVISWAGLHISLSGTVGRVMKTTLRPTTRLSFHTRTATWLVIGIAITTWGAWTLVRPHTVDDGLPLPAHMSMSDVLLPSPRLGVLTSE